MGYWENLLTVRAVQLCSQLPRDVIRSPSLEMFKRELDLICQGCMVQGVGLEGL